MRNDSRTGSKLKGQITRWANWMTEGLGKADRRWVREMVYGIQASEDVKLSNVARSLGEGIALIEVEQRLSRQRSCRDRSGVLNGRIAREGSYRVRGDTVLAVDVGDMQKRYREKMEYLAEVRDGSTGEIGKGYWMLNVIGSEVEVEGVVPVYHTLYSQEAEGWESENTEIMRATETVRRHVRGGGIWGIDRGGDRASIYNYVLGNMLRFVIRVCGKRHLRRPDGEKVSARELGRRCRMVEEHEVRVYPNGGELRRILDIYLTRWKSEESWRFVTGAYGLEEVRVRSYVGLRNIVAVVGMVFYFVSVELGGKEKLNLLLRGIYEKAERFYAAVGSKLYAIADGIHKILFGYRGRFEAESSTPASQQLLLNFKSLPTREKPGKLQQTFRLAQDRNML